MTISWVAGVAGFAWRCNLVIAQLLFDVVVSSAEFANVARDVSFAIAACKEDRFEARESMQVYAIETAFVQVMQRRARFRLSFSRVDVSHSPDTKCSTARSSFNSVRKLG